MKSLRYDVLLSQGCKKRVLVTRFLFILTSILNFIIVVGIFFFVFRIKFRKTKQKVVTFVTTTLIALLSIAKTNVRLSGSEFYTGNIYYSFFNFLSHMFSFQHIKRCVTEATHRKTRTPSCRQTNLCADRIFTPSNGSRIFTKWISFNDARKRGIIILKRKKYTYQLDY